MTDRSRLRLFVLRALVLALLLTLFGRLWYLQVLAGDHYAALASDNQLRDIVTQAARGDIVDDVGRPLVRNRTTLVVSVDRTVLSRQKDGGKQVLDRLASVIHLPVTEIQRRLTLCGPHVGKPCWAGSPYQPIPVDTSVSPRQALMISDLQEQFPGVTAEPQAVRDYPRPLGVSAAHELGYLGPITTKQLAKLPKAERAALATERVGQSGLEASYDTALRGQPGVRQVSVDSAGNVTGLVKETPPVGGDTLVTSLDAGVQKVLEKSLVYAIGLAHSNGSTTHTAAGVVEDARTGHIIAMASYPTYDPSLFAGGSITDANWKKISHSKKGDAVLNLATQGEYPPGSTFKLISTAAYTADGVANLNNYYDCSQSVDVGGHTFNNFEGEAAGSISLHTAIVKSCDTVFYRLADAEYRMDSARVAHHKKPVEGLQRMARAFGLGKLSGIDLPSGSPGLIQDRAEKLRYWKQWLRPNSCKGAKRRAKGTTLQALDAYNCRYGGIYLPGDEILAAIGQGTDLVTPLQLANAYAALANGGTVYEPRLGKAILAPDGHVVRRINAPVRDHLPVRKSVLTYIEDAMYGVTHDTSGTGHSAFAGFPFSKVNVGGKTGTAQVSNTLSQKNDVSWFASFGGPAGQQPRYVVLITVPGAGQGGLTAAPAVRKVWEGMFGLNGQKAALRGGQLPHTLPHLPGMTPPSAAPSTGASHGGTVALGLDPAEVRRSGLSRD